MNKKIIPIISLVLIALLAIATIVLAVVPKSYSPVIETPTWITVNYSGTNKALNATDNKDSFNKIVDLIKGSFSETSLNSLFNGRINDKADVVYKESLSYTLSSSTNYVRLDFYKDIDATVDGKVYYNGSNKATYQSMIIEVSSSTGLNTVNIYLLDKDSKSLKYYYTTIANYDSLTSYLSSNFAS
jgi:hypothetical protein